MTKEYVPSSRPVVTFGARLVLAGERTEKPTVDEGLEGDAPTTFTYGWFIVGVPGSATVNVPAAVVYESDSTHSTWEAEVHDGQELDTARAVRDSMDATTGARRTRATRRRRMTRH
jgi:hypothetical protein